MLRWAIIFALIALVASALGFGYLEGTAAMFARLFALVFVIIFIVSVVMGRRVAV